jgi:hypothetical protein
MVDRQASDATRMATHPHLNSIVTDVANKGLAALTARQNRIAVTYGAALLLMTLIYIVVSTAYVPNAFSGQDRDNTQTYVNVGFSAILALTNGLYYVYAFRGPAKPRGAGAAAPATA